MGRVESHQDNDHVEVRVELDGLDSSDVHLDLREQALEIRVLHVEAGRVESVAHTVSLPAGVTEDDLEVTCEDDVLAVRATLSSR